jgi:hypothetical protein
MFDKASITLIGHLNIFDVDTGATLVRRRDITPQPLVVPETVLNNESAEPDATGGRSGAIRPI